MRIIDKRTYIYFVIEIIKKKNEIRKNDKIKLLKII